MGPLLSLLLSIPPSLSPRPRHFSHQRGTGSKSSNRREFALNSSEGWKVGVREFLLTGQDRTQGGPGLDFSFFIVCV